MREAQSGCVQDPGPRAGGRAAKAEVQAGPPLCFPLSGGVEDVGVTCFRSGKISGLESGEGRKTGCVWGYVQAETRDMVPLTWVGAMGDRQNWGGVWVTTGRFAERPAS